VELAFGRKGAMGVAFGEGELAVLMEPRTDFGGGEDWLGISEGLLEKMCVLSPFLHMFHGSWFMVHGLDFTNASLSQSCPVPS
jgi:hypothetical protein